MRYVLSRKALERKRKKEFNRSHVKCVHMLEILCRALHIEINHASRYFDMENRGALKE